MDEGSDAVVTTERREAGSPSPSAKPPSRTALWLSAFARRLRSDAPLLALDTLLISLSYLTIFSLRFGANASGDNWGAFIGVLPLAVLTNLAVNWRFGLYRQMWRHASIREAARVGLAT